MQIGQTGTLGWRVWGVGGGWHAASCPRAFYQRLHRFANSFLWSAPPPSFPTPPIKNKDGLQYHSRETCGKCAKVKYPFPHKQEAFEVVARLKLIFAAIADQPISMQCKTDSFMKFTPLHQPHSHTHGHFRP